MINIKNLKAWYTTNQLILKGVNLNITDNTIIGLIGLNGAGKTTMIKTICGIHEKYSIDKLIFNEREATFTDDNFKLNRVAVFSENDAFDYWTFNEFLNFMMKSYNCQCDKDYLKYLIDGFNFRQYLKYKKKDLSLGNKKKFFLITAFCLKRQLLILDEPIDGLDFESTQFIYKVFKEYKQYGSILMATHILESITSGCDKLTVLKNGLLSELYDVENEESVKTLLG
ncbi:ABC transporter, partial [Candidatus Epulonipiscioides gigas]